MGGGGSVEGVKKLGSRLAHSTNKWIVRDRASGILVGFPSGIPQPSYLQCWQWLKERMTRHNILKCSFGGEINKYQTCDLLTLCY